MIKRNNTKFTAMSLIIGLTLFTGCTSQTNIEAKTTVTTATEASVVSKSDISVEYAEDDYYKSWEDSQATTVELGSNIEISGVGAQATDSVVTITQGGTYIVSGTLEDGQIVIDTNTKDTVRLVLNGVSIHSTTSAPIYAKNVGKMVISLEDGTTNTFTDGESYTLDSGSDEPDGAIFSKGDLTINGTGTLIVNANYMDAIVSKDRLRIMEGNIDITAVDDGIRGKDMVAIKNGNINITSTGEAIKSTNIEDASKGFLYIEDGEFNITSESDALQAETNLEILDGVFNIATGGGSNNGPSHMEHMMHMGEHRGVIVPPDSKIVRPEDEGATASTSEGMTPPIVDAKTSATTNSEASTAEENATIVSTKAIKAGNSLTINGGSFTIDSADDAVHSTNVVINGGTFSIKTGDDGIHADLELIINNGQINIEKSYEGLEAERITVQNGEINIIASDDGINAEFTVNGGYINVDASGDGLDANGTIIINDGTVIVNGPTNGGNGALDYDKTCDVNGGILIAAGSMQMAQTVTNTSAVNTINMSFTTTRQAGETVSILDENGNIVVAFTPSKEFQVVMISSEAFETGKTYTYSYGGTIQESTADGLVQSGTYSGGTIVGEFTISDKITYLNESGVTTASHNNIMGRPGQGEKRNKGNRDNKNINQLIGY